MIYINTNPQGKSWATGEFQAAVASGIGIIALALNFNHVVDQATADIVTKLAIQAVEGLGAIVSLAIIAITIFTKRTDLKTALIENGLETADPVVTPVVETPTVDVTPAPQAEVAQG